MGDLYQDLSEEARKKYALLQTPVFVEEFILDRTLDPAIEEFGLAKMGFETRLMPDGRLDPDDRFKMIDPACGSGHFLLGSFARLVDRWRKKDPGAKVSVLVQRALDGVHGVDVNPYAIAIARFRLLLAALKECGVTRLSDAPGFEIHLACGDSLLHGSSGGDQQTMGWAPTDHVYQPEDRYALERLLRPKTYHAVVANPPYITPKDRALNQAYRDRYSTCHLKYSLAVPFLERIVSLAVEGGFTGQITANSFMKREFGKKLIEEFFPRVDLTHVIDTSGAYIPGHGTPTVILFARKRRPVTSTLRTVMGIRGEPATPDDPEQGLVWSAIVSQVDQPGSQSQFVSVGDSPRELFHKHPWSIGGGGAAELKKQLEERGTQQLDEIIESMGFMAITGEDEVWLMERKWWTVPWRG
ncbi:MAG: BREX-2 system adenine-specific DNA-methyltransferase PglX [Isosphaeraceae bacterium]